MATDRWLDWPSRDLWQHTAALKSLIADMHDPLNPFVSSFEPSRHFHPYWALMALLARLFGWSAMQTINVAGFFVAATLTCGFYLFGRAYFRSDWGPLATLLCCTLGWMLPVSHTGYVNIATLVEGIAYPAPLLMGLSLVLWACVMQTFEKSLLAILIVPLSAIMFSIHQLGATLGFMVALPLALTWPGKTIDRVAIIAAIGIGVAISTGWIYFNPIEAVMRVGNPTWRHGVEFYRLPMLVGIFVPSCIGLVGLLGTRYGGPARPLLIAFVMSLAGFVAGAFGVLIGTRFGPMAAFLLLLGLASLLVPFLENPAAYSDRFKLTLAGSVFGVLLFQGLIFGLYYFPSHTIRERKYGNVLHEATLLTSDIPHRQEVAAYDVAAWPLAAAGQKVLSVPWPEPFIGDLNVRQAKVDALFDPRLSREERVDLARKFGVRTLILDERFGPFDDPREWPTGYIQIFKSQAAKSSHAGPVWRFDLY